MSLAHFLLVMLLLLIHILHSTRLEIVHGFSALKLLLLVLELLEVADVRLHLLLVALDHYVRSVSANQDLGRHS